MKLKSYIIILVIAISNPASAQAEREAVFHIFSSIASKSTVSMSLAGAGSAMIGDGFQGLVNPSLTSAVANRNGGTIAVGYQRDMALDLALPFGLTVTENGGAMGFYYRYLDGELGRAHDMVINFSGRAFEQSDSQGPVEFGVNFRYEQSDSRQEFIVVDNDDGENEGGAPRTRNAKLESQNFMIDIGFYQPRVLPGLDFSLVFGNVAVHRWNDVDGKNVETGWAGGRYRTVTVGMLYSLPLWNTVLLRLPIDVEGLNLFSKSMPNKYIVRAGAEIRIAQSYGVRFGYAHAPEDPAELITDFNHKNLFFGGMGIILKPVQMDFFIGKDEFGVTATYFY